MLESLLIYALFAPSPLQFMADYLDVNIYFAMSAQKRWSLVLFAIK